MHKAYCVFLCLTFCGVGASRALAQNPAPDADEISKKWKVRGDRVSSAKFTIKTEATFFPVVFADFRGPMKGQLPPEKPIAIQFTGCFMLKDDELRYDYSGKEWSVADQALRDITYSGAFDGELKSVLYQFPGSAIAPSGRLYKGKSAEVTDASSATVSALYVNLKPNAKPSADWQLAGYKPTGKLVKVDGAACHELSKVGAGGSDKYLYLDPAIDWSIRQKTTVRSGVTTFQYTIDYVKDPVMQWRPSKWKWIMKNGAEDLLQSESVSVIRTEFNAVLEDSEFRIPFPPGTRIYDDTKGER